MTELSQVPNEVILNIFPYLHPSTLIDFTCLCKRHYALSTKFLKKHKELQAKYLEISDRCSSTVPTVLREILLDPRLAWYIRRLIVYERTSWKFWEEYGGRDCSSDLRTLAVRLPEWRSFLSIEDLRLFREALQWLPLKQATTLAGQIEQGGDDPLKLLLAYLAPNIETLVVTAYDYIGQDNSFVKDLSELLRIVAHMPKGNRPACFKMLSRVHLNHWVQRRSSVEQMELPFRTLVPFLTLPALETLYVGVGGFKGYGNYPEHQWEFETCSSAIKTLGLAMMDLDGNEDEPGQRDCKQAQTKLLRLSADTLETIQLGPGDNQYCLPLLRECKILKDVIIDIGHLFPEKMWRERRQARASRTERAHWSMDLNSILPASIERLKITGHHKLGLRPRMTNILVEGLADFVKSKAYASTNLQGICTRRLYFEDERRLAQSLLAGSDRQKIQEVCEAADVVYSGDNQEECKICVVRLSVLGEGIDWSDDFQC